MKKTVTERTRNTKANKFANEFASLWDGVNKFVDKNTKGASNKCRTAFATNFAIL